MTTLETVIVIVVLLVTFWRRDIFFYIVSSPVAVVAGLSWRGTYTGPDGIVISLAFIGIGIYCLIMAIWNIVRKFGN